MGDLFINYGVLSYLSNVSDEFNEAND